MKTGFSAEIDELLKAKKRHIHGNIFDEIILDIHRYPGRWFWVGAGFGFIVGVIV